jgi:predicted membrane channel-forming protein YqfA (hemolysin III family)
MLYWAVFILLVIIGAVKILLTRLRQEKGSRIITAISVIVGITAVLLLAMGREAYGVSMLFLMIVAKGIVIYKMR